jgi:predicted NAD/FAD-binding protein
MEPEELLNKIPKPEAGVKSVCILGAGISGLALAYYLLEIGGYNVTIFEAQAEIGGNCRTFNLKLDDEAGALLVRWADMGVNDYNKTSYKNLDDLMQATGYIEGLPLEDTESYGNPDGSVCYTNDGKYFTPMPADISADSARFQQEAFVDWQDPQYAYFTLNDYVTAKGYSADFINNNLYARVNGMYFCSGAPAEMPFRAVMSYYSLQEGYGNPAPPDRRYFKNGTKAWIDSLAAKLEQMAGRDIIIRNASPVVVAGQTGQPGIRLGRTIATFDAVVLAMHADDAIKAFGSSLAVPPDVLDLLVQFQYVTDESVAHTDSRSLQPQINSWRTYNINVYDFQDEYYGPYTITYVVNRHQNDCQNPLYAGQCEYPQYLVSVNPVVKPAESAILQQTNGQPGKVAFRHQKLTINTVRAQEKIAGIQGKYGLWYANGYVKGAGLHEECIINAKDIAYKMSDIQTDEQFSFDLSPNAKRYAPDYVVNAHKKKDK